MKGAATVSWQAVNFLVVGPAPQGFENRVGLLSADEFKAHPQAKVIEPRALHRRIESEGDADMTAAAALEFRRDRNLIKGNGVGVEKLIIGKEDDAVIVTGKGELNIRDPIAIERPALVFIEVGR